jgi:hypothetical protein
MHEFHVHQSLEEGVLWLYQRAIAERRWEVAEPLMCALEQLAKENPACEASVEQAYLCICSLSRRAS